MRRARLAFVSLVAPLALALAGASCGARGEANDPLPRRACGLTVWVHPASDAAYVEVVGDWNGWARPGTRLLPGRRDGWRAASFDVAPGEHAYAIVEDGTVYADPLVGTTAFHDGQEVTSVDVADCAAPGLRIDDARGSATGAATVRATFLAANDGAPVDPASLAVTERDGTPVTVSTRDVDAARGAVTLGFDALAAGKHTLTIRAQDRRARAADARATVWIEPSPHELADAIVYQVIVDRFRGPNGAPLAAPSVASGRAGGTVDGVRAAIESGELQALGVDTVWLSPLYLNPDGEFPGSGGHTYSSYHGYWPIAPRTLDARLATDASLDTLVAAAHARGLRVLFDVVPNHVHAQHPYVAEHMKDGWFNHPAGDCVCGVTCDWGTHIQDCWFAPYLPDLDWTRDDVAHTVTADVLWWLDRWDADGLRIDAVPMMPRAASRRIASAVRARYDHPGHTSFLLGEHFTGAGGYDFIRYDLGPYGLNSEFDFPLMWTLRSAVAQASAPMSAIDDAVKAGEAAWGDSGAVMATMIGNHDVPRFASVAAGDGDGDPWSPAVQPPDGSLVYAKQALALAAVFTLPGAPVVYYGDELALVGHADPDSRRVYPAEAELGAGQRATRDLTRAVATLRRCAPALRRGRYRLLATDAEHVAFARELDGAPPALVVLTRDGAAPFAFPTAGLPPGAYVDALGGDPVTIAGPTATIGAASYRAAVFLPAGDACAAPNR